MSCSMGGRRQASGQRYEKFYFPSLHVVLFHEGERIVLSMITRPLPRNYFQVLR
jgi:hypothetical protein